MRKAVLVLVLFSLLAFPSWADAKSIGVTRKVQYVVAPDVAIFPMVTVNDSDTALTAALSQPSVGGLCFIIAWRSIEPTEGVYRFGRIDRMLALCQEYGKGLQLMVYTGKWAPAWLKPKFTCYFKGNEAKTYASWNYAADVELDRLWAILGERFDGQLHSVWSSGGSVLNGVEMCMVIQDTWTAKQALIAQGYSIAGYRAALERQIERTARTFPKTNKLFMLHYLVHNDATNNMYQGLASYAASQGVLCSVGFLQADTDNAVFAGRTGGVASCTRTAWNMRGPGWGLLSWNPQDVQGTWQAAQALSAE